MRALLTLATRFGRGAGPWRALLRVVALAVAGRGRPLALSLVGLVAASAMQLLPPILLGTFLNVLVVSAVTPPAQTHARMNVLILEIVGAVLGAVIVRYLADRTGPWVAGGATLALRLRVHEAVLSMSLATQSAFDSGSIKYRIADDTGALEQFVGVVIPTLTINLVFILGGLIVVFVRAPFMAAIVIVPAITLAIGTYVVRRVTAQLFAGEVKFSTELWTRLAELVAGAKPIRVFGREEHQQALFARSASALRENQRANNLANATYGQAFALVGTACTYMLYYFGGLRVINPESRLSAGDLIALVPIAMFLFGPLSQIAGLFGMVWRAATAAQRLCELLDAPAATGVSGKPFSVPSGPIVVSDLRFGYDPSREVLRGFSLRIEPGQLVALVGRSGAGKTTALNLLCRLYEPLGGEINWGPVAARTVDPRAWRLAIGVVMQETYLFKETLFENIRCGRAWIEPAHVRRAAHLAGVDRFIDQLPDGYETQLGDGAHDLSVGQKQRVGIARALASDPALIVLDEPTASLDGEAEAIFLEALSTVMRFRMGLVIAHRLSTVARADRIVVIDDGRAIESGTFTELMSEPRSRFRSLFGLQEQALASGTLR
jgi:ATP-binding cassette, subfamily B, bacterial